MDDRGAVSWHSDHRSSFPCAFGVGRHLIDIVNPLAGSHIASLLHVMALLRQMGCSG